MKQRSQQTSYEHPPAYADAVFMQESMNWQDRTGRLNRRKSMFHLLVNVQTDAAGVNHIHIGHPLIEDLSGRWGDLENLEQFPLRAPSVPEGRQGGVRHDVEPRSGTKFVSWLKAPDPITAS